MGRRLQFSISLIISITLHAMMLALVLFMAHSTQKEESVFTPVQIVNLPQQDIKKLPPIQQRPPVVSEKRRPPDEVPIPKKFGTSNEIKLPKMLPHSGKPDGTDQGKTDTSGKTKSNKETGPLPFLTQRDIDELARKGMPAKKPGDESVTLDTDEFKFMSYNRWLKIKVESVLRYPELAAISGYQGTLYIKFDILKNGSLGDVELLKSSGYKILDDEALRSIRDSAPFQPLPEEWNMDRYSIRAAVIFYMNEGYIR